MLGSYWRWRFAETSSRINKKKKCKGKEEFYLLSFTIQLEYLINVCYLLYNEQI